MLTPYSISKSLKLKSGVEKQKKRTSPNYTNTNNKYISLIQKYKKINKHLSNININTIDWIIKLFL